MAKIDISVNKQPSHGQATVPSGRIELEATAVGDQGENVPAAGWRWIRAGAEVPAPDGESPTLVLESATSSDSGTYEVRADVGRSEIRGSVELTVESPATPPAPTTPAPGTPTTATAWHSRFAMVTFIVAIVAIALLWGLTPLRQPDLGLDTSSYAELTAGHKLAARVIGPVLLLALTAVLLGVALALVEWRGTFAAGTAADGSPTTTTRGDGLSQITETVKAMSGLKGASLVLTVGVLLVLATAWITASSTAAVPSPEPSATATTAAGGS